MTAVERVLQRLPNARRIGAGWSARCPAHDDASPSLSIREGRSGALVRCWAGCELEAIVTALELRVSDLFNASVAPCVPLTERRAPTSSEVAAALRAHLRRQMDEEAEKLGYRPPLTSRHHNRARVAIARTLGVRLAPVAAAWWECPPFDDDPLWPILAQRALAEIMLERGHATPSITDRCDAHERAARLLHDIARYRRPARTGAA